MNSRGQAEEFIIVGIVVLLFIGGFIGSVFFPTNNNSEQDDIAANNFCESWASEQEVAHLEGYFKHYLNSAPEIVCKYSIDAETFDGGISEGTIKYKYFKISEEDLQEWVCVK